jgi:hypothetical protein
LLIGVEIRVIAQGRDIVAHVIGRHDDVAFGSEHGRQYQSFAVVAGIEVGNVIARSVCVPWAYSTMGRGPWQAAVPLGTMSAPEAGVRLPAGSTVCIRDGRP